MNIKYLLISLLSFSLSISNAQIINTFAGGGSLLGDGGPATAARLDNPGGMIFNANGDLLIASGAGNRIRKISVDGTISTIAGTGTAGYSGDGGSATAATLRYPTSIAIDTVGNIFISEGLNYTIRKIDIATGTITTICGNGIRGYTGDGGPASSAQLYSAAYISFDKAGNLYIAESSINVIRRIDVSGIINTIAGTGISGYNGDGILASTAQLNLPVCVITNETGEIIISDQGNARIRKINTTGYISTISGDGTTSFSGDGGPAISAKLTPTNLKYDKAGNLYVTGNYRVSKISTDGILNVVAGTGTASNTGDGGLATAATMHSPIDVVFDDCENMYISVNNHNRVRKVTYHPYATPSITISGVASATVGATVTVAATVTAGAGSYTISWLRNGALLATTSTPSCSYTKGPGTDTITARLHPTVAYCSDTAASTPIIIAELPVGAASIQPLSAHIYPTPTTGTLHIQASAIMHQAQLQSLTGTTLATYTPGTHQATISIAHLPPGIYTLRINHQYIFKVVKQ